MNKLIGYIFIIIGYLIVIYGIADFILGRLGYANLTFFLGNFFSMFGPYICILAGALIAGVGSVIKD